MVANLDKTTNQQQEPEKKINVKIDGVDYAFDDNYTIIQACEAVNIEIPRFCYHKKLQIAGNCRMCLVDVVGAPKLTASCAVNITDKMVIETKNAKVKAARESVMETLLINHPLDCPICDQGGECDLQDQAMLYGGNVSHFHEEKRAVPEKNFGRFIKTAMTRCIHCTRCVRFMDEVAGSHELDVLNRGENSEIVTLHDGELKSRLSGNIIDLCPVGALTNGTYAFKARLWELKRTSSIDVLDPLGSNIFIDSYGIELMRILPRENDNLNEEWISDITRFAFDGLRYNRLMDPLLKNDRGFEKISWEKAFNLVYDKISTADPEKIFVSSGDLADLDSILYLKNFCETLKIKNFDFRSSVPYLPNDFYSLFNTKVQDISQSDCIFIIGCDIEEDSPVLNTRIRKHIKENKVPVFLLGSKYELNYSYNHLGNNISILKTQNEAFEPISSAKKPMVILGEGLFQVNQELADFVINQVKRIPNLVSDSWNGLNILFRNPGTINGLVANFSQNKTFYTPQNLDVCYLLNDDTISMDRVSSSFTIYQGHHGDGNAKYANLILPGLAYTEKSARYANLNGLIQKTNKVIRFPGNSMKDSDIIKNIFEKFKISHADEASIEYLFDKNILNCQTTIDDLFVDLNNLPKRNYNIIVKNSEYFKDLIQ
jgi:NADH-quinone oxidoreductase subunit G